MIDYEFYETPAPFVRWLFAEMAHRGTPIVGNLFEPCVGDGAIIRVANAWAGEFDVISQWVTNDLDRRWPADYHEDATSERLWTRQGFDAIGGIDWTVTNPPFTPALDIITHALEYSRVGVAMHLRASIHEPLKGRRRRSGPREPFFLREYPPTGILWLPRFGYQRSKTTGKWTTDSVCACWVIWLKDPNAQQFIRYAPEWVIDELDKETPAYRKRMDALMADYREQTA